MIKRAFDVIVSGCALLLLSPIMVVAGLWVALDSGEPPIFRQIRVGLRGREFRIYKFRTMRTNAEQPGPEITIGRDKRITKSGHFLRKYKLDELPQLLNVLMGEMSLVGPRPEVPRYVKLYPDKLRETVLSVRPGITDLASIEFRDENTLLGASNDPQRTYVDEIMPRKLRYCVQYVESHNLWKDGLIILKTVGAIFNKR